MEDRVVPSTITVTSLDDGGPGTLRAAIVQANGDTEPDEITFASSLTGTINLTSALPSLLGTVSIEGPGASSLTVNRSADAGTPSFRIFEVSAGANATISGLTVSGGLTTDHGGGIDNAGTLALVGTVVSRNTSAIAVGDLAGGGISNSGTLTITDSAVTENSLRTIKVNLQPWGGNTRGAGIYNSGVMTVTNSTISDNTANAAEVVDNTQGAFGGGIFNSGSLSINNSTLNGNTTTGEAIIYPGISKGAGIYSTGPLAIANSTLSDNEAIATDFGGISSGGAIDCSGTTVVTNTTFSGNTVIGSNSRPAPGGAAGGAILNSGTLTVTFSTFSSNKSTASNPPLGDNIVNSGNLTLASDIFTNPDGFNVENSPLPQVTFLSLGHNLFSDAPNLPLATTDLINTDPLLGPLADNGGPTRTMALLPGSPAIDAGSIVSGVTDQRGVPRTWGSAPDIGAFESRGFQILLTSGNNQSTGVGTAFAAPLGFVVSSPFGEPIAGGRVTIKAPSSGPSALLSSQTVTLGPDGRGSVTAQANTIGGSYGVTAVVSGAENAVWNLTNQGGNPLVVRRVQRMGVHWQPTRLVLTFNEPLDPIRATNLANYQLLNLRPLGRTAQQPRQIPILSAQYNAAKQAVILEPAQRLDLTLDYQLTVVGDGADAVTAADGTPLEGISGRPQTNFVVKVHGLVPYSRSSLPPRALAKTLAQSIDRAPHA